MRTTVPMDPAAPEDGGYGLGLYWVGLPNGPAWGHDGGVIGQATLSLHSSASVSFAQNMTFYAAGPNPIDDAVAAFLLAALGNTATAEAKTGTPTLWRDRITSLEALPLRRVT
jgi:D-alanyl-D-alanine carboxypeptidase